MSIFVNLKLHNIFPRNCHKINTNERQRSVNLSHEHHADKSTKTDITSNNFHCHLRLLLLPRHLRVMAVTQRRRLAAADHGIDGGEVHVVGEDGHAQHEHGASNAELAAVGDAAGAGGYGSGGSKHRASSRNSRACFQQQSATESGRSRAGAGSEILEGQRGGGDGYQLGSGGGGGGCEEHVAHVGLHRHSGNESGAIVASAGTRESAGINNEVQSELG